MGDIRMHASIRVGYWMIEPDGSPRLSTVLGNAILVRPNLALTCASTFWTNDPKSIAVAVPGRSDGEGDTVIRATVGDTPNSLARDVVALTLVQDVPSWFKPALLRYPDHGRLTASAWQTVGCPTGRAEPIKTQGSLARPRNDPSGRLMLRVLVDSPVLDAGFRGSPVWSADEKAVIGIVTDGNGDDGAFLANDDITRILASMDADRPPNERVNLDLDIRPPRTRWELESASNRLGLVMATGAAGLGAFGVLSPIVALGSAAIAFGAGYAFAQGMGWR